LKSQFVTSSWSGLRRAAPYALFVTSVAGLGRLPQVSLPLGESAGVPVGLSLIAAHGQDAFLLVVVHSVAATLADNRPRRALTSHWKGRKIAPPMKRFCEPVGLT